MVHLVIFSLFPGFSVILRQEPDSISLGPDRARALVIDVSCFDFIFVDCRQVDGGKGRDHEFISIRFLNQFVIPVG